MAGASWKGRHCHPIKAIRREVLDYVDSFATGSISHIMLRDVARGEACRILSNRYTWFSAQPCRVQDLPLSTLQFSGHLFYQSCKVLYIGLPTRILVGTKDLESIRFSKGRKSNIYIVVNCLVYPMASGDAMGSWACDVGSNEPSVAMAPLDLFTLSTRITTFGNVAVLAFVAPPEQVSFQPWCCSWLCNTSYRSTNDRDPNFFNDFIGHNHVYLSHLKSGFVRSQKYMVIDELSVYGVIISHVAQTSLNLYEVTTRHPGWRRPGYKSS